MHWSANSINRIISSMNELKQQYAFHAQEVKNSATQRGLELVKDVFPTSFSGIVAAVDSGFSSREFVSLDVLLLRSVASIFTYDENKLISSEYFPNRVPGVSVHYGSFPDVSESACFKSLSRLSAELNCALQVVSIYKPKLLLLDGSLLPLPADKPPASSSLFPLYQEVLSTYSTLFAACEENKCELVGIVKDSRSQKLCNYLRRFSTEVSITSDELLCNYLLSKKQRTMTFSLDEPATNINCFYLKAGDALPYRVEFIGSGEENATQLAGQLCGLGSTQFAYPSILIEVDMRAALTPREISALFDSIKNRTSDFILRSSARPFRWQK